MTGASHADPAATPVDVAELVRLKTGRTVSVVLPALDEQETVAGVVASVRPLLGTLVDELVVVDSGSRDATVDRARAAGARVAGLADVLPELPPRAGKGEVLWRSLAMTTGDLVVFVDADLLEPDPAFVPRLLGPLLVDASVQLVKGFYRRPLRSGEGEDPAGGGRVTELCARPLLAALVPELAGIRQPLGGEYAATRELLESVPFAARYGVEIGLLVDTWRRHGIGAIAQVDLGVRRHRNRPLDALAVTAREVVATLLDRCGVPDSGVPLGGPSDAPAVCPPDRPPLREVRARAADLV